MNFLKFYNFQKFWSKRTYSGRSKNFGQKGHILDRQKEPNFGLKKSYRIRLYQALGIIENIILMCIT